MYGHSVDPLWRQTFFLYVRNVEEQTLDILVEAVTEGEEEENICLGKAQVTDLKSLCNGDTHDISLDLHRSAYGRDISCSESSAHSGNPSSL